MYKLSKWVSLSSDIHGSIIAIIILRHRHCPEKCLRHCPEKCLRHCPEKCLRHCPEKCLRHCPEKCLRHCPEKQLHLTPETKRDQRTCRYGMREQRVKGWLNKERDYNYYYYAAFLSRHFSHKSSNSKAHIHINKN